jgi:glyoxylase-like metal-dependent hydrolase (beta-lactamase superfamily II)
VATPSLDLGGITITWLDTGSFELDGGTMFGAVPKLLWARKYPPDDNNYIKMLAAPLLIRTPDATLVVDTGIGNKLTDKQKKIYHIDTHEDLSSCLAVLHLNPKDIDYVILTHCDFDHAGGIIRRNGRADYRLTFPGAKHIVQKREWEDVCRPNSRSAHTYLQENFSLLVHNPLLHLVDNDVEIIPGVTVRHSGGHTRGHQVVEICGLSGCAVHMGDLMPTHAHANPLWHMAYDNFPLDVVARKEEMVQHYREKNCWFTFYHDAFFKAVKLDEKGDVIEKMI